MYPTAIREKNSLACCVNASMLSGVSLEISSLPDSYLCCFLSCTWRIFFSSLTHVLSSVCTFLCDLSIIWLYFNQSIDCVEANLELLGSWPTLVKQELLRLMGEGEEMIHCSPEELVRLF